MKILITGAKGMLGQMLNEVLKEDHELILTDREEMDITDKSKVFKVIKLAAPEIIIHAAAFVDVEAAEDQKALAKKINVAGSRNIAQAAQKAGATIINISSDYVYDGKKRTPYKETDKTNPRSVYAISKRDGECEIIRGCKKYYILRVAWLFGECDSGRNFVEAMIKLAKSQKEIKVIDDQFGSPTYTRDIADITSKIISKIGQRKPIKYGIYHLSGTRKTTRFGFCREIFRQLKIKTPLIPITTKEFFAKAPRPAYSYLDKSKIEKALKLKIRPWQKMLRDYFKRNQ